MQTFGHLLLLWWIGARVSNPAKVTTDDAVRVIDGTLAANTQTLALRETTKPIRVVSGQ